MEIINSNNKQYSGKKLILDLNVIKEEDERNEDENFRFKSFLKMQDEKRQDKLFHEIYKDVSSQIDCTTCGNCCKEQKPSISDEEILGIIRHLNITEEEFIEKYTEFDAEENERYIKDECDCPFLEDKKCTIYEFRPHDCRSYPHLHKRRMVTRLLGVVYNLSLIHI